MHQKSWNHCRKACTAEILPGMHSETDELKLFDSLIASMLFSPGGTIALRGAQSKPDSKWKMDSSLSKTTTLMVSSYCCVSVLETNSIFYSSAREDIDTCCLWGDRPFVLETPNVLEEYTISWMERPNYKGGWAPCIVSWLIMVVCGSWIPSFSIVIYP